MVRGAARGIFAVASRLCLSNTSRGAGDDSPLDGAWVPRLRQDIFLLACKLSPPHSTQQLPTRQRPDTRRGHPRRATAAPQPGGWSSVEEPAMRRVELPGSAGDGPKKAVVISYVPLLTGEPGRVLSVADEEFQRLMAEADRCRSGLADACLWMADNGGVFPVFVLP